jgi:Mg-chelatase subunit ChlD
MSSDSQTPLDMKCILNRTDLKADTSAVVFLAIDLAVRPLKTRKRKKMNVALAIDTSGSMMGEKIKRAIEFAIRMSKELTSDDFLSIISFSSLAKVLLPSTSAGDSAAIEGAIRSLMPRGATDLYGGLEAAIGEAEKNSSSPGVVSRIILLTDGQPTEGKTHDDEFISLAMGARSGSITITTVGIGDDYNEDLLTKIAQNAGGVWYHVRDLKEDLQEIMVEQVTEITNTAITNPILKLELMKGAEIMEGFSVRPMLNPLADLSAEGHTYVVPIPDLIVGDQQNFAFRIKAPAKELGEYPLVTVSVQNTSEAINVNYTDDATLYNEEANPYPRILLASSSGTVMMRKGIENANKKLIDQASNVLKTVFEDPKMGDAVETNSLVEDVVTTLQAARTSVLKGIEDEDEKKQVMQDTTIIVKRGKKS